MFKNRFGGEKPRKTKDGHKDYHLKADTGYINSQTQTDRPADRRNVEFNFFIEPKFANWKLDLGVPGFGRFGIMKARIYLDDKKHWEGKGVMFFGVSHFNMTKKNAMTPGKKYKVILSRWI